MNGTINMAIIYGVIAVFSLGLTAGYYFLVQKKERLLLMIHCAVFVVNTGYFLQSVSKTLNGALFANRISYLGAVCLPLCMLLIILNVCRIQYGKKTIGILLIVSGVVFLIAASPGYLNVYYKNVSIKFIDGAAKLVKEYGPLHQIYYLYLFSYFGAMVGVILYSAAKKDGTPHKLAVFLASVVLGNVGIWFVEQMIDVSFEFLSVSYIITELLLVLLYSMLEDGVLVAELRVTDTCAENSGSEEFVSEASVLEVSVSGKMVLEESGAEEELAANSVKTDGESTDILHGAWMELLTAREKEVLFHILSNKKRKDIAEELCVSENTIKKHTSHIFAKLGVTNRLELFEKIK